MPSMCFLKLYSGQQQQHLVGGHAAGEYGEMG